MPFVHSDLYYQHLVLGDNGTHIWNLKTGQIVRIPADAGSRGATTALVWVIRQDDPDEALVFGTTSGYFVFWKKQTDNTVQ